MAGIFSYVRRSQCKGLSAPDADSVQPKGLTWTSPTARRRRREQREMPTEPASERKDRGREQTWTRTEGTELVIEFTVVYYGHGRIYTTKTCGLPATSVLHQVRWSVRA